MRALKDLVKRRPGATATVVVIGAAVIAFGIYWFGPQDLLVEERVSEAAPTTTGSTVLAEGEFRSLAHDASGTALVLELEDGSRILRFEDLNVSNGPDLKVYLSTAPSDSLDEDAFAEEYVNLGELAGNIGDQNYEIPADVDLSRFRSAVVWCERFSVGFAVAPIEQA